MSETTDTAAEQPAVLTEQRGRVLLITLNRPDQMNAINGALSHGLWDAVQQLNGDPGLTAGVLTGNGRGFCSGMDLEGVLARRGHRPDVPVHPERRREAADRCDRGLRPRRRARARAQLRPAGGGQGRSSASPR
ncbi:MAG: enoyl-CoA hydratase-related protein [Ilumatobacteraceae bacterium]